MDYLNYLEMHSCDVFHWGEFGRAQDYDLLMVCSKYIHTYIYRVSEVCYHGSSLDGAILWTSTSGFVFQREKWKRCAADSSVKNVSIFFRFENPQIIMCGGPGAARSKMIIDEVSLRGSSTYKGSYQPPSSSNFWFIELKRIDSILLWTNVPTQSCGGAYL